MPPGLVVISPVCAAEQPCDAPAKHATLLFSRNGAVVGRAITDTEGRYRVQLPLLKEVGWAVIDYIRHGRPDSDCPQVFLRHLAPIGPFSDQEHLHGILVKHARVAHVPVSEKRRHGMHSLRHTLATRLMEGGTPVEQIADILGHQSVQSTGVYLKSSLGLLSKCALDPDAPAPEVSR